MSSNKINYQKLNQELEAIIIALQSGDAGIDKSVALYERGETIIKKLQDYLNQTENTIKKIQDTTN